MVVYDNHEILAAEEKRLKEDRHRTKYWKKWGSYLAERQWATGSSTRAPPCSLCGVAPARGLGEQDIANDFV